MQVDTIVLDSAERLFQDVADIQSVVSAKNTSWKEKLWSGIEENGLNIAAVPECLGGAEIGLQSALGILRIAGRMALSAPLAETILAGWMLGAAGLTAPTGKIAFGPARFGDGIFMKLDGTVSGRASHLPFASECSHAVLLVQGHQGLSVVLVPLADAQITSRQSLAYEPLDHVTFKDVQPVASAAAPAGFDKDTALLMGAAARSMQIAGAMEKILAITMDYATQRKAFERTISKFQAVQHGIAQLAGEVAVSLSAAESAAEALDSLLGAGRGFDDPELQLEVMSAKIRVSTAIRKGAAIAHQLHGAIGVTNEHILHRLTLRGLAWRDDYGNESQWSEKLGTLICGRGAEALWPLLSTR
ncbi:MAG: acyl-CoA dehydrogenase family protein [Ferrovibrio sp.]|uniref:acyl-CoA dehydrogenase family protein n=1 Tax=Ferrovibrio sp. TaxID=1917215 RepID=UPI0026185652|nr:acyl-CoA dehydrogenase family protein [Ferrovibrio sp.]MCW0235028.1 acyl-CoA dehydrogenase family protein [Ferrovibrio sp.]